MGGSPLPHLACNAHARYRRWPARRAGDVGAQRREASRVLHDRYHPRSPSKHPQPLRPLAPHGRARVRSDGARHMRHPSTRPRRPPTRSGPCEPYAQSPAHLPWAQWNVRPRAVVPPAPAAPGSAPRSRAQWHVATRRRRRRHLAVSPQPPAHLGRRKPSCPTRERISPTPPTPAEIVSSSHCFGDQAARASPRIPPPQPSVNDLHTTRGSGSHQW